MLKRQINSYIRRRINAVTGSLNDLTKNTSPGQRSLSTFVIATSGDLNWKPEYLTKNITNKYRGNLQ